MNDRYVNYIEKFIQVNKVKEKETYRNLFNKLSNINKFIADWENEDLDNFIKNTGSISVNAVSKYLYFIREIYEFVCREEGKQAKHIFLSCDLQEYIDLDQLLKVTLTERQYKLLKPNMTVFMPEGERNYRDKVLLELAWEGLTNQEIKHLKIDDIDIYMEYGRIRIRLNLGKRTMFITDEELIYNIKKCIGEEKYWLVQKNRAYEINYKQTPNLIKPVAMRQSNKNEVANPSMLLNGVLRKLEDEGGLQEDFSCTDLNKISLEDIRRSRIIHEFKDPLTTIDDIKEMFGKRNESDLYWIQEVAQHIEKRC